MSLTVTAYDKLAGIPAEHVTGPEFYLHVGFFRPRFNPDFPARTVGLNPNLAYKGEKVFTFDAGNYGNHEIFLESLAKLAGYPKLTSVREDLTRTIHAAGAWASKGGPFGELINFNDLDATFGPFAAAQLARDFAAFQAQATREWSDSELAMYQNWRKAFEIAASNGLVQFS